MKLTVLKDKIVDNVLCILVVTPTYNEKANLCEFVKKVLAIDVASMGLVIVDDNSPDGTGDLADQFADRNPKRISVIHRPTKLGLKTAYQCGFQYALESGAEIIVQMDADLSHSPEDIPILVRKLETADVVIGSRYIKGGGSDKSWGFIRKCVSYFGNLYLRSIGGVNVYDGTSGFKAFRRTVLEKVDLSDFQCSGFGFQAEFTRSCLESGFVVVEHPIIFKDRIRGDSKMSLGIVFEALWKIPIYRIKRIKLILFGWLIH